MAITFAQPTETLAPCVDADDDSRDASHSKTAQPTNETARTEKEARTRRESFFDFLRIAFSTPHV